jgi:hypothetical protein
MSKKKKPQRRKPPLRRFDLAKSQLTGPKKLTMGVDSPSPTPVEEETRVAELQATIKHYLPEFAEAVEEHKAHNADMVIVHQDAFAAGYHDDEYTLMGMALKYAGLVGMSVLVQGTNHETF